LLVPGLNLFAAVVSTRLAAPVIAAAWLRRGLRRVARRGGDPRPAGRVHRPAGLRVDSVFHSPAVLGAIRAAGACCSVTAPMHRMIRAAIASVSDDPLGDGGE
jgi:hypothetical protein